MKRMTAKIVQFSLLVLAAGCIFMTSILTVVKAAQSWAQCGNDSYIECSGGVRCTSTDQVGCSCYDAGGRRVDHHTCREASPGGIEMVEEESQQ